MRIAFVNHRDWLEGGMDKVALVHLTQLARRGHKTALFTQFHERNQPSPYRKYYPTNAERLDYRLRLSRLSQLHQDIRRTFHNPEAGQKFGAFLDDFRPEIVHVHGLLRAFSPAIYEEAKKRGIPLVQTHHYAKLVCPTGRLLRGEKTYCHHMPCIHGKTLPCVLFQCQQRSLPRSIMAALEFRINRQRYIQLPDLHLAPSHYLKNLLAKGGLPVEKLHYHPNFVDTEVFKPGPHEHKTGKYFLYFGRIAHEKGLHVLLDAFAPLRDQQLYIIGTGPALEEYQRQVEQESLGHIHFVGQMDEERLVPWIQNARATILPSLWGEIFGLTVIESFACRTPAIGSRVGAIPELIIDGINGLLVEPNNPEALRAAILEIAALPLDDINTMGNTGLKAVRYGYSLTSHLDQLLNFYNQEAVTV